MSIVRGSNFFNYKVCAVAPINCEIRSEYIANFHNLDCMRWTAIFDNNCVPPA